MRSMIKIALATLGLAASLLPATPASATSFADCPWGTVNGSAAYTPALTTTATTVSWSMSVTMNCVGSAPAAGTYTLTMAGISTESCTSGTANGTVNGTGPTGAVNGTTGYQRFGIHLYGFQPFASGTFSMGGKSFTLAIWFDVYGAPGTEGGGGVCPLAFGTVIGHAAITEL